MKGFYFLMLLCFSVLIFSTGCSYLDSKKESGNGNVILEKRNLEPFDKINMLGNHNLIFVMGDNWTAEIMADENLMDYLITEVKDGELVVKSESGVSLVPTEQIIITVTAPLIAEFTMSGSGNIQIDNLIAENQDFQIKGSGNINADISAFQVRARILGSGSINLKGNSETARFRIAGSGNINADNLEVDYMSVDISGSGSSQVYVLEGLDVSVTGSGNLTYKGNPSLNQKITGSGKVRSR